MLTSLKKNELAVRPGVTPPRAFGVLWESLLSYSIEAQRRAQYRGRFAFVRKAECANKTKPRGELIGYKGRILGLLVFGVVAVSRFSVQRLLPIAKAEAAN